MSDPFVESVRAGIGSVSEVISLAEDLEGVAQQVQDLGKKELAARKAWRHKAAQVKGDYAFVNAVDEYRTVREAMDMKAKVKAEAIRKWGPKAWEEIEKIEARQKEDFKKLYTEDGHDRAAMTRLKWQCFGAAALVTLILWMTGVVHELAVLFYGE